ncbi:MotA/TolQ/ExbB proton channel family protein [Propionivibrio sp.]|uniref:MotA/TolQ/ExbB proton channel family protein n=1 Tax=Propionivibrio sp. TaxID=2212460 RepID=UPI003BEF7086
MNSNLGLVHFWQQGDLVTHSVAILLVLLSVASWSLTITRFILQLRFNRSMEQAPQAFWLARALPDALKAIEEADKTGVFAGLAKTGIQAAQVHGCPAGKNLGTGSTDCATCAQSNDCHAALGLGAGVSLNECVTRALRNHILHAQARMESGLTFLASVGSTAPFIGLFGTVWGIYHALVALSGSSSVVLDKVAGPVGEALIMTAGGLFVAIPAVLAYNALTRGNRLVLAQLDGFAHDLHAFLTTGARRPSEGFSPVTSTRPVVLAVPAVARSAGAA